MFLITKSISNIMQNKLRTGKIGILTTLLLVFVIMSCDNDDTTTSQELLEETAFAENVFAQLSSDIDDAVPFEGISSGRGYFGGFGFGFGNCMTRTVESPDEADYPKTITIEYDRECTSGFSGVVKSGKIIITLTGPPREKGAQRIVTFEDFTVNGNQIDGIKTFTHNGNGQYSCVLEDGKIISKEGDVIIRESTKTRTLVSGGDTEDRSDDVYEVTGIVIGETSDGTNYQREIISPLVITKNCFWITEGVVETTIGEATSTINFGDGTCDNIATRIDENGIEEEFTMEMRIRKMFRHTHKKHKG